MLVIVGLSVLLSAAIADAASSARAAHPPTKNMRVRLSPLEGDRHDVPLLDHGRRGGAARTRAAPWSWHDPPGSNIKQSPTVAVWGRYGYQHNRFDHRCRNGGTCARRRARRRGVQDAHPTAPRQRRDDPRRSRRTATTSASRMLADEFDARAHAAQVEIDIKTVRASGLHQQATVRRREAVTSREQLNELQGQYTQTNCARIAMPYPRL